MEIFQPLKHFQISTDNSKQKQMLKKNTKLFEIQKFWIKTTYITCGEHEL